MKELTPAQQIHRIHSTILRSPLLVEFSPAVMFGDTKILYDDMHRGRPVKTAMTDGRNIYISKSFMDSLTEPALTFVVLHETLHIVFRHMIMWHSLWEENAGLANAACDYVINLILLDLANSGVKGCDALEFPKRPDGTRMGLVDNKYRNMNTKQVFDLLKEEQEKESGGDGSQNGSLKDRLESGELDEHDFESQNKLTATQREDLAGEIDRLVRQGRELAGRMDGNRSRAFSSCIESTINYVDVLRDYVRTCITTGKSQTTFRRYNRRLVGQDLYMPSQYSESFNQLIVAIDTSGSITLAELDLFLSNLVKIASDVCPKELVLLYWESSVVRAETYEESTYADMLHSTSPEGGGGTVISCVPNYIREHNMTPDCVLVLTDGEFYSATGDAYHGNWEGIVDPMWCVTSQTYDDFKRSVNGYVSDSNILEVTV